MLCYFKKWTDWIHIDFPNPRKWFQLHSLYVIRWLRMRADKAYEGIGHALFTSNMLEFAKGQWGKPEKTDKSTFY
jgi:hypothetical protein